MIVRFAASSAHRGQRRGELKDIACVVEGALLVPEGTAGSGARGTTAHGSLHAIIAQGGAEDGGRNAGFVGRSANRDSRQLSTVDIADMSGQEGNGIAAAAGSKVGRAHMSIAIVLGGDGLAVGIGQTVDGSQIVVGHRHVLCRGRSVCSD